jgi:uroporphyrinogen decarboxylase
MMTPRERYISTVLFQKPDRVPFSPGGGRKSTLEAWHRQGLPEDVDDYHAYVRDLIGIEPEPAGRRVGAGVDFRMIPQFEEQVLERRPAAPGGEGPGSLIVQDWKGNVCEISDEFDVSYLRDAIDFVTRTWIRCPVESRSDWEAMKERYDAGDPARFPNDFCARAAELGKRDYVAGLGFAGPFWQLREWLGFENLCMLFVDDPELVHEMVDFWEEFVSRLLVKTLEHFVPDCITINEDMAYKEKPMIGPDMCREFLSPCWRRWVEIAKGAGVEIVEIDSDGHVGELIPVWIEAGVNMNSPQEVAAGNDLPEYRRRYGDRMAYAGGVDKRAMAAGGEVLRREIERLRPVIDAGGFIPSCDHGIPSDVSWPNFVEYCRLLAAATGWL